MWVRAQPHGSGESVLVNLALAESVEVRPGYPGHMLCAVFPAGRVVVLAEGEAARCERLFVQLSGRLGSDGVSLGEEG
jgi:hypothetical protein